MANVDTSIVNIALPSMAKMYGTDATGIAAIVQSYLLTITAFLLIAGRLVDAKTPERILRYGFIIFTASSLLCAIAPSLFMLTFFRFIQGIGAAFMFATSSVIIVRYVPAERRGRAYSVNGLMAGVGVALGAPIGGMLLQYLDWRWIFLINLPIGVAALIVAHFAFTKEESHGSLTDFDWWGAIYSFVSLSALLYAFHCGEDKGWGSIPVVSLLVTAGIFLALFLVRQARYSNPLLDLSLFRNRPLTAALIGNACYMAAIGGLTLVLPFYFTLVKHLSPKDVGLIMMISPGISIMISRLSGHYSDKIGPRPVCIAATVAMVAASGGIITFGLSTSYMWIIILMVVLGVGRALYVTASLTMVMTFSERGKEGMLSAAKALIPNLGRVIGVSIFILVYNGPLNCLSREDAQLPENIVKGFDNAAWLGLLVAVLMLVSALLSESKKLDKSVVVK
jgi:EmrB/QacA subfamily drug resistance transporter